MVKDIRDAATLDEFLAAVRQEILRIGELSLEDRFREALTGATEFVREIPFEPELKRLGFKILAEEPLTFYERCFLARHLLFLGRRKAGRPAPSQMRDILICMWVEILASLYELNRMRNTTSPPYSACDAVAQALSKVSRPFAYDTVRKIYARQAEETLPGLYQDAREFDLEKFIGNKTWK